MIHDICLRLKRDDTVETALAGELSAALCLRHRKERQDTPTLYRLHALDTECIGTGKTHKPQEFWRKVSITTTNVSAPCSMFVFHASA